VRLGDFDITLVDDGVFGLDGGSMFGIVPRPGWERLVPPDTRNRIDLALRVILVRAPGRIVLLDAGIGGKLPPRLLSLMNVRRDGGTPARLLALGIDPGDVTDVILSHLHFDHAGGASELDGCALRLTYPNAVVHVQRACWDWALSPSEKDAASFWAPDVEALKGCAGLNLLDGDCDVVPGIRVISTRGHTPGMQVAVVASEGAALAYLSDLAPTVHHLKPPYIMAFDLSPLYTLAEKKRLLNEAADGGWIAAFGHDIGTPACRLARNDRGDVVAGEPVSLTP
jgi:glyoxylase-like metal-dependent hydrolase (beta-lactamase superfamily II)